MKTKIKFFALPFLALLVLFAGCSSDDSKSADNLFIKFTHNGVQYNFIDPYTSTSLSKNIRYFEGSDDSFVDISLWMPLVSQVGTFVVTDTPSDVESYNASFSLGQDLNLDATSGSITITSVSSEYIQGTFTFSGTSFEGEEVVVTNGSFRAYNIQD
ncbi:DUF6252 family protein [Flavobacterium sp. UBA6135]|uniref:DUF6252 family protein n=1 Tax=Flavobacterium sp. UBA6135 TaxID=1946553 RepID=UPI0025BAB494|nr:DUF6252 family protein [Flavobacterium sp. UBA6135]